MQHFCNFLMSSPVLFFLTKTADMTAFVTGCVILSSVLFRAKTNSGMIRKILCGVILCANAVFQTMCSFGTIDEDTINIYIETLVPFICVLILYLSKSTLKQIYKPVAAVFIYNIVPVITQLVKMFIPWIDSELSGKPEVFGVEFLINMVVFFVLLGLYVIYAQKSTKQLPLDKIDLPLYALIILALSVFIASLAFIDRYIKDTAVNNAYFILLLNIPTIAAAIAYASRKMVRSKMSAEAYKTILDENIKHYESLEEKNEELRIYRHDFPKTISPVLMCIRNGDIEEAERILSEFNTIVQSTKPKFSTGNHRLDNVLETEAQKAEKSGIEIVLTPGSKFPPDGIDPIDIYTIFPNALDNAIEATDKTDGNRVITVKSKIIGRAVYVRISNPYKEGRIRKSGEDFITTKADKTNHGFGTKSIKKAVAKYGEENIFFETENGTFTLSFSLEFEKSNNNAQSTLS